jgi:hypothetical protein
VVRLIDFYELRLPRRLRLLAMTMFSCVSLRAKRSNLVITCENNYKREFARVLTARLIVVEIATSLSAPRNDSVFLRVIASEARNLCPKTKICESQPLTSFELSPFQMTKVHLSVSLRCSRKRSRNTRCGPHCGRNFENCCASQQDCGAMRLQGERL